MELLLARFGSHSEPPKKKSCLFSTLRSTRALSAHSEKPKQSCDAISASDSWWHSFHTRETTCAPQTTIHRQSSIECDLWIAGDSTNQLDRFLGLGSGEYDESSFPGECVGGRHAGIGDRRSAVGTENSLRHVNRQNACVETASSIEASAQLKQPSAAAEVCCSIEPTSSSRPQVRAPRELISQRKNCIEIAWTRFRHHAVTN